MVSGNDPVASDRAGFFNAFMFFQGVKSKNFERRLRFFIKLLQVLCFIALHAGLDFLCSAHKLKPSDQAVTKETPDVQLR
jgi:hypothetical protein